MVFKRSSCLIRDAEKLLVSVVEQRAAVFQVFSREGFVLATRLESQHISPEIDMLTVGATMVLRAETCHAVWRVQ
ncbi:MAG TPA: hypothetical protein VMX74_14185, partial [Pirellulales bacterium]|nr:hypothetical protein [Pirellulales bacterium]